MFRDYFRGFCLYSVVESAERQEVEITYSGSSYTNVNMCWFSESYMYVN